MSLSARRAWIEIHTLLGGYYNVAVALRKESVDRNYYGDDLAFADGVALRKESVDRNIQTLILHMARLKSLSARRAWIEIVVGRAKSCWLSRRSPQGERG